MSHESQPISQKVLEYKKHIHDNPEIGWAEVLTTQYIKEQLDAISLIEGLGERRTGAVFELGKGQTSIFVRADIDALKTSGGPQHLCGHSTHTAALMGAYIWLKEHESRLNSENKKVIFLFQPAEEVHEHFTRYCERYHLSPIRVLSPTSTNQRIAANLKAAQGFIYCTAVSGTTGARNKLDNQTQQFLERMKRATDIPLAVGFGISQPEHVKALTGFADIAVVGSAVIQKIEQNGIQGVKGYLESLVQAET